MNRKITIFAAVTALSILAGCAREEPATVGAIITPQNIVSKAAIATDGDTVLIDNENLNLWGIRAPDMDTTDGWFSRAALNRLIGEGSELVCVVKVKSEWHPYFICSSDKVGDIGLAMLQNGWAIRSGAGNAGRVLADAYNRAENHAFEARTGLWVNYPRWQNGAGL